MSDPVIEHVDSLGVAYEIVACEPDLADTAAFCDAYGFGLDESANAIVVIGKSKPPVHVMCVVLADGRLDINHTVRKRLGVRKASFASADETVRLTSMEIGGVTPFGASTKLPVWIDARVMECERVIVGGGGRDRKLLLPPTTLTKLDSAEVVEGLATQSDAGEAPRPGS